MASSGIYVDANLLVLLVAGLTRRGLISKHRRLREYSVEDYDLLIRILEQAGSVFVTPNTVPEASNLLSHHGEPERSNLMTTLGKLIEESHETVIPSKEASSDNRFVRLGVTDVALLRAASPKTPLLTVDLDLFLAASAQSGASAINFNHRRFSSA